MFAWFVGSSLGLDLGICLCHFGLELRDAQFIHLVRLPNRLVPFLQANSQIGHVFLRSFLVVRTGPA